MSLKGENSTKVKDVSAFPSTSTQSRKITETCTVIVQPHLPDWQKSGRLEMLTGSANCYPEQLQENFTLETSDPSNWSWQKLMSKTKTLQWVRLWVLWCLCPSCSTESGSRCKKFSVPQSNRIARILVFLLSLPVSVCCTFCSLLPFFTSYFQRIVRLT